MNKHAWLLVAAAVVGVSSAIETRLSVWAALLLVIALASSLRFSHPKKRAIVVLLGAGVVCTLVGMYRFVLGEALPGIIEARGRATSARAVSILREVLFAEDAARRYAMIDPDGDRVGSAGLLGELTGADGARGGAPLPLAPLAPRLTPRALTSLGPALEQDGYFFIVCLPGRNGDWVTRPQVPIDDELAERRWVAYAWPSTAEGAHTESYFIDEHETILATGPASPGQKPPFAGPGGGPSCTAALENSAWKPWKNKVPRKELPGSTPER